MVKKYHEVVEAIQWDGKMETLDFLKSLFPDGDPNMWIVDSPPDLQRALRVTKLQKQGDFLVLIGDYLKYVNNSIYHFSKEYWEDRYTEIK